MLGLWFLFLAATAPAFSCASTKEQISKRDVTSLSESWPLTHPSDYVPNALQKRRRNRLNKWHSHTYVRNNLRTWVFGNHDGYFNITMSALACLTEPVGVYDFRNGTRHYNATVGDIRSDLAIGSNTSVSQVERAYNIRRNALMAIGELQAYLKTYILCKEIDANTDRDLLWVSEGRVTALLLVTAGGIVLGILTTEVSNNFHANKAQLAGGALAVSGAILFTGIAAIARDNGAFTGFEGKVSRIAYMTCHSIFL